MSEPAEHIKQILDQITNKRARIVIKHILEYGFITTEELEKTYGYKHPPRAARDVREAGIPLETFRVKGSHGRSIAAYRFGDLNQISHDKLAGRRILPKKFREDLYEQSNGKCAICHGFFELRYLQIDHRIPYEITGDVQNELTSQHFMLICSSCNRSKSWSCEQCSNWQTDKSTQLCSSCYWTHPNNTVHIALREIRRIDILWNENEIELYEKLKKIATQTQSSLSEYIKYLIARHLDSL